MLFCAVGGGRSRALQGSGAAMAFGVAAVEQCFFPTQAQLQRETAVLIDGTYSAGGHNNAAVMAGLEEH